MNDENNQPITKRDSITVHNGIITNIDDLYIKHHDLKREYDIDTEIIPLLLNKYIENDTSISKAFEKIFDEIEGSIAIAINLIKSNTMVLTTNYGCLYTLSNNTDFILFASEHYILKTNAKKDIKKGR